MDLDYKDTVQLVSTQVATDGYGTEIVDEVFDVEALMIHNTGEQHGNYRTEIVSDAQVYLNPENEAVINNFYRLEGMAIVANQFGNENAMEWYRITQVIVGEDKLLDNEIDNVNCQLKKISEIPNVS